MDSIDHLIRKVVQGSSPSRVLENELNEKASQCHKYRADADTCSTGCTQSRIARGSSCPWSDDWDSAAKNPEQGCYCYG